MVRRVREGGALLTPTIVVGTNGEAIAVAEQLMEDRGNGHRVIGFVDTTQWIVISYRNLKYMRPRPLIEDDSQRSTAPGPAL